MYVIYERQHKGCDIPSLYIKLSVFVIYDKWLCEFNFALNNTCIFI